MGSWDGSGGGRCGARLGEGEESAGLLSDGPASRQRSETFRNGRERQTRLEMALYTRRSGTAKAEGSAR